MVVTTVAKMVSGRKTKNWYCDPVVLTIDLEQNLVYLWAATAFFFPNQY